MPFKSEAQARFMYSQHPEMAKEFSKDTNFSKLPERKKKTIKRRVDKLDDDND